MLVIRKIKKTLGDQFEEEYCRVEAILKAVLPKIKQNGWKYQDIKTQTFHPMSNQQLNISELEDKICDHYFEYTKELYETTSPELRQIHTSWYAVLRDFTQTYLMKNPEKMHKRINDDFGKFFDEKK